MSVELENARKLVALDDRAKAAQTELNAVSRELQKIGKDLKVSGWNWAQAGGTVGISTQGSIHVAIVDEASRTGAASDAA